MWKNTGQNKLVGRNPRKEIAACAKKTEDKMQVNKKSVGRGMHIKIVIDEGKGKKLKKKCVVKDIEHQQKKKRR